MFLAAKAKAVMDAYPKMRGKVQEFTRSKEVRKQLEWKPPPINYFTVNADAAVYKDQ